LPVLIQYSVKTCSSTESGQ